MKKIPEEFLLESYQYELPEELIAYYPSERREESRLLVLDRKNGAILHRRFRDIKEFLREGDLLVLNDTRVFPARLIGRKETGGRVEVLLLRLPKPGEPTPAIYKGKKLFPGYRVIFSENLVGEVVEKSGSGVKILLKSKGDLLEEIRRVGKVPLPPYIKREAEELDLERYQTVYARKNGSVAAPTAGLHLSEELLRELREQGIDVAFVTLHVGYGTFSPIRTKDIRKHRLHEEYVEVPQETVELVERTKREGGRVVAVGTTSVRALEWAALEGRLRERKGWCDLYIYPGFEFKVVDALVTNFHLPGSSLLVLVCAFAERSLVLKAYREAVRLRYRFFSYGDAMLIL